MSVSRTKTGGSPTRKRQLRLRFVKNVQPKHKSKHSVHKFTMCACCETCVISHDGDLTLIRV